LQVDEAMWAEYRGIALRLPSWVRGFPVHHKVQTGPEVRIRWVGWGFTPKGKAATNKTDISHLVSSLRMLVIISSHFDIPPWRG